MGLIQYSTNWMGPIATRWYEDRNIPFEVRETSGKILPKVEYKHFLESYSCGRIDIYGLDESEHWGGKSEYSVAPMRTEDWNALGDWLDKLESSVLLTYRELISDFEKEYGRGIRWVENDY
ncbi:hypothetical protein N9H77_01555 [Porticoccaceae bacterium]|nr:hypothetical protein [Porticoccaceae bacterium]